MSSPPICPSDSETESPEGSTHTLRQSSEQSQEFESTTSTVAMIEGSESVTRSFGTAIQKFSKDLIKSPNSFKFTEELTDDNYVSWSQAVSELLQSIDLEQFVLKENFLDPSLSEAENLKVRFIITTFVLNRLDSHNNLQARNFLSDPDDPHVLVYDPFKI